MIYIKNMVCRRCIMAVTEILKKIGLTPIKVELGHATIAEPLTLTKREQLEQALEDYGFELIDDKRMRIIEQIKTAVIKYVHYNDSAEKIVFSDYLVDQCHHDYSFLSKLFSEVNGISIEKYVIAQKVERIKELLVYDEMTISEISYKLHYSSVAHLSAQFKSVTDINLIHNYITICSLFYLIFASIKEDQR